MPENTPVPPAALVFIVDDDISVRESLEELIKFEGWLAVTCASAEDFLALAIPDLPNCLILDISLPNLTGLDLQDRISADRSEMPIIFITGFGDVPTSVRAMKAGAVEFLTKPFSEDALISAVRLAIEHSTAVLADRASLRAIRDCFISLSRREREVMARVVAGLLNKQVGFELGISEITVKAHRGQVMRKMKARSLPDLVNMNGRLQ